MAGRVAQVSGNAAMAAAIARGVGGPPSPALRPVRPLREPSASEDSKGEVKDEPLLSPKREEPAALKKEDSKTTSKEDLKKEKERKEKEEKERKEREKREKEEKEKKEKERAKAEKEKKEKEKKDKDKKGKDVKGVKPPVKAGAAPGGAVDIPVQDKPKEQELVHLTKERPKGPAGNRKPPTRRPRPPTSPDES